jgi:hypothetical protein
MDDCPTLQQLDQMLTERIAVTADGPLRQHVRSCARCQTQLDTLTDDPELKRWLGGQRPKDDQEDAAIARALGSAFPTPDRFETPGMASDGRAGRVE